MSKQNNSYRAFLRLYKSCGFLILYFLVKTSLFANDEWDKEIQKELKEETFKQKILIDRANIPHISVVVDMLGDFNLNKKSKEEKEKNIREPASDSFLVREVELAFQGAIDQLALGTINFAAHEENGAYITELHEVYFEFHKLPANAFLKVGKFFMDAGRLNNKHRHAWDFSTAPMVFQEFFGSEGVDDTGAELSFLMPFDFYQVFLVGVFNGRNFGHSHELGPKKPNPLYTSRFKNFFLLNQDWGCQIGLSYLRYNVDNNPQNFWQLGGIDFAIRKEKYFSWKNELWYRKEEFELGDPQKKYGAYSSFLFSLTKVWDIGFRYDVFVVTDSFDPKEDKEVDKASLGQNIWATYKPSEFSYFRLGVEKQDKYAQNPSYLLTIQADFIIGEHPPHRY